MNIPTNVLKAVGLESNVKKFNFNLDEEIKKLPRIIGTEDMDNVTEEQFANYVIVLNKTRKAKVEKKDICKLGLVYDQESIKWMNFLSDNIEKLRLIKAEDIYKFSAFLCFDNRMHNIVFRKNTISKLCPKGTFENEHDSFEARSHYLKTSEFIPILINNKINSIEWEELMVYPYMYKDIEKNEDIMYMLSSWLNQTDVKPNIMRYYTLRIHKEYGATLVGSVRQFSTNELQKYIPIDSMLWSDIKESCLLLTGLQEYLSDLEYEPKDNIYYFVKMNSKTGELWLKRDLGQSPKAIVNK